MVSKELAEAAAEVLIERIRLLESQLQAMTERAEKAEAEIEGWKTKNQILKWDNVSKEIESKDATIKALRDSIGNAIEECAANMSDQGCDLRTPDTDEDEMFLPVIEILESALLASEPKS